MFFGRYRTTKRLELVIDACLGLKQMYKVYEEFNASRLQPGETNVYTSGKAIHSYSSEQRFHLCFETFHSQFLSRWAALS